MKILIEYCKLANGENVDLENVKRLIDSTKEYELNYKKVKYYDRFGIKYHFNEEDYYYADPKNIIPEKIILKNPQYSLVEKLKRLTNCEVTLDYTKVDFLSMVNDNYKILSDVITRKANKTDEVLGQMIQVLNGKLTTKSRKIAFKEDVNFPIVFKITLSSKGNQYGHGRLSPKEVMVNIQ